MGYWKSWDGTKMCVCYDAVLYAVSEQMFNKYNRANHRRKFKVNPGKNRIVVFGRNEIDKIAFGKC